MRRRFEQDNPQTPLDPLVRLWMLRILVPMGGLKPIIRGALGNPECFAQLGVDDPALEDVDDSRRHALALPRLTQLWKRAEAAAGRPAVATTLRTNLAVLGDSLGLDGADLRLLEWACLIVGHKPLADCADALGPMSARAATSALARVLDLPLSAVQRALGTGGSLPHCGLLKLDSSSQLEWSQKLTLVSDEFADAVETPQVDPLQMLRGSFRRSGHATLSLDDYPHIGLDLAILRPYLDKALSQRRVGVNVLLYGPPGTGKTQLARSMAQSLGCDLYEVLSENRDGDPISAQSRLGSYALVMHFVGKSRAMVVFDECSDVFDEAGFGVYAPLRPSTRLGGKAWMNRTLENNPVPTFWLSNDIGGMDAAMLRRFDIVIELAVPPQPVRRAIAQQHCGALASQTTIDALACSERLAPAVLTRAAQVAGIVAGCAGAPSADVTLLRLVNQTLRVQGFAEVHLHDPARLPDTYDPALVNTDVDLAAMAAGVARAGSARLCLYGPPGTGKSAFARWLAQQIGRPLVLRRASDLISKWLGESEQNIARAFREAQRDGAVLVIDEVDSFLQERHGAERSWEVTQVNEMLTQMEAFSGVFVATTNLIDGLDAAALRRFDLKAKFDFLRSHQAVELLNRQCAGLGLGPPDGEQIRRIGALEQLTPGDFAAVVRRHAFQPLTHPEALVSALSAECALKAGAKAAIGFITH